MALAPKNIRNFSIIAHIDHGKSTLADRLIEFTGTVSQREMEAQILDSMDIEKERGITIKAQTVRLTYKAKDGQTYFLNLIDTPGHVDFTYEVSRSLGACEGAILVVDTTQGVEAQTLANVYMALNGNLEILPVLNKIDLPSADPERVRKEIEDVIGIDASHAVLASAKSGIGIEDILEASVKYFPPPKNTDDQPLRALIFDSWFDPYQGVVTLARVFDGTVKKGDRIRLFHVGKEFEVMRLGMFTPKFREVESLSSGDVGCFICGIKDVRDTKIGDTICAIGVDIEELKGFQEVKPMVFSGLYPIESDKYNDLKDALEKLRLNDSAFTFEPETSTALGFGFRCGFLGLLHMDVVQERLEREYNLNLITTAPSVIYKITKTDGEVLMIDNPARLPADPTMIAKIEEPYIRLTLHLPNEFVGSVIALCEDRRGNQKKIDYITADRVLLEYEMPLSEMVFDFFDRLKSSTRGYASMDYELIDYRESELIKLDVLINGEPVDALSLMLHKTKAAHRGRELVKKMKELIDRQMFEVIIQAAIGHKIVARETVGALRKNVTAKCYGGDISRKRKLLEKQKEGKKRMKQIGTVEIPQEAFLAVLKVD